MLNSIKRRVPRDFVDYCVIDKKLITLVWIGWEIVMFKKMAKYTELNGMSMTLKLTAKIPPYVEGVQPIFWLHKPPEAC